jgi:hypothetical protein
MTVRNESSARCLWLELELQLQVTIDDAVPRLLVFRVDMCEPADTSPLHALECGALGIKQRKVVLHQE